MSLLIYFMREILLIYFVKISKNRPLQIDTVRVNGGYMYNTY